VVVALVNHQALAHQVVLAVAEQVDSLVVAELLTQVAVVVAVLLSIIIKGQQVAQAAQELS
jgi:hypothetical protein